MADGFVVRLEGIDKLRAALAEASATIRKKAVRGALREAGKVIQAAARAAAPVLAVPTDTRASGTVRKAIAVRASRFARQQGDEGVFINVRPAKGAKYKATGHKLLGVKWKTRQLVRVSQRGANSPTDPFYWRFLEFGTRKMAARPFLRPAAETKGQEVVAKFMASVIPQIEKLNAKVGK